VSDEPVRAKRAALARAIRVGDQSCTAYAYLRDKYQRYSFWLDLAILLLSAWLTSMVFVQPRIAVTLSPRQINPDVWIGLLSILAFALSLVQLLVDWKGRAHSFQQAATSLSGFVKEHRSIAMSISEEELDLALARYSALTDGFEPIPEGEFLALKRKHRLKVEFSRLLDERPGASLTLWRLRMALRDNTAPLPPQLRKEEDMEGGRDV
jgi:hypothetical protein